MRVDSPREARLRRHLRIRRRVSGTSGRPRLCVFRSLNQIYAQIVDDALGNTLAAASSLDPDIKAQAQDKPKIEVAKLVGGLVCRRARERGIEKVVFDRAGYSYHGRVKALAEAAREGGLNF